MSPGHWEQQSALFGIVRMNSTYNGHRLGTALFKVCDWLGITHKISWVTCDNASNNNSIMMHFAAMIQWATGKEFNAVKWQIQWDSSSSHHVLLFGSLIYLKRCLVHIINLVTQAVISKYSKSKYHDPEKSDDDLMVSMTAYHWDKVGLIWTIMVKVCYCVTFLSWSQ